MNKDKKDPLTGEPLRPHEYDGIQEFDNRLPNWWLWTFYGAIIFTVLYWFSWYNMSAFETDGEKIAAYQEELEQARLEAMGDLSEESLWQMSRNSGYITAGKEVFTTHCVTCHGANLEGGIGLSLVDAEWKWGNDPMSVYAVVANGSPDTKAGMQAWMSQLGPKKVSQVVSYVLSHHTADELQKAKSLNPPVGL